MRKQPGWLIVITLLLLAGCASTAGNFTDDFSDPSTGWGAASHETFVRGYQQGQYFFQIDVPQWFVWTTGGRSYSDVSLEAQVRTEGTSDNHYGLLCRYRSGQFYYFAISADGYYAIFRRVQGGDLVPLTGPAMLRSPLIHTDGSANRLLAVCQGSTLTLSINGEQVAQVQDNTLTQGDIGMAAGTAIQGRTMVWFDDLSVKKP